VWNRNSISAQLTGYKENGRINFQHQNQEMAPSTQGQRKVPKIGML
jgi:hypothetical protein